LKSFQNQLGDRFGTFFMWLIVESYDKSQAVINLDPKLASVSAVIEIG
jgi:hypothetical protein